MKLYITGDTHGDNWESGKLWRKPFSQFAKRLTKDDVVLIAGDFGWCWNPTRSGGEAGEERKALDHMEKQPYTLAFIDGNHENFDRLYKYPEGTAFGGPVGVLRPHVLHLKKRGHIYDLCGHKVWCFGGAKSFDIENRIPCKSWWPQEEPTAEEYEYGREQLEAAGWRVDLVVTHEAPSLLAKTLLCKQKLEKSGLPAYLQRTADKLCFRKWYFGHYHKDAEFEAYGSCFGGCEHEYFSCVFDRVLPAAVETPAAPHEEKYFAQDSGAYIWNSLGYGHCKPEW